MTVFICRMFTIRRQHRRWNAPGVLDMAGSRQGDARFVIDVKALLDVETASDPTLILVANTIPATFFD